MAILVCLGYLASPACAGRYHVDELAFNNQRDTDAEKLSIDGFKLYISCAAVLKIAKRKNLDARQAECPNVLYDTANKSHYRIRYLKIKNVARVHYIEKRIFDKVTVSEHRQQLVNQYGKPNLKVSGSTYIEPGNENLQERFTRYIYARKDYFSFPTHAGAKRYQLAGSYFSFTYYSDGTRTLELSGFRRGNTRKLKPYIKGQFSRFSDEINVPPFR